MWDVDPVTEKLLRQYDLGRTLPSTRLPNHLLQWFFSEPWTLFNGVVDQWWNSAKRYGANIGPRPRIAINDSPEMGAYAFPSDTEPLITINAGTCIRITQLMNYSVNDTAAFPWRSAEQRSPEAFLSWTPPSPSVLLEPLQFSAGMSEEEQIRIILPVPTSIERQKLASAMRMAALEFIVMHEISHMIRKLQLRHIGAAPCGFSMRTRISEDDRAMKGVGAPAEGDLERLKALELDADAAAAQRCARHFTDGTTPSIWHAWSEDPRDVMGLWISSISLMFFLFDGWTHDEASAQLVDYPPPVERIATTIGMTAMAARDSGLFGGDLSVAELATQSIPFAVGVWERLGLPATRGRGLGRSDFARALETGMRRMTDHDFRSQSSDVEEGSGIEILFLGVSGGAMDLHIVATLSNENDRLGDYSIRLTTDLDGKHANPTLTFSILDHLGLIDLHLPALKDVMDAHDQLMDVQARRPDDVNPWSLILRREQDEPTCWLEYHDGESESLPFATPRIEISTPSMRTAISGAMQGLSVAVAKQRFLALQESIVSMYRGEPAQETRGGGH